MFLLDIIYLGLTWMFFSIEPRWELFGNPFLQKYFKHIHNIFHCFNNFFGNPFLNEKRCMLHLQQPNESNHWPDAVP